MSEDEFRVVAERVSAAARGILEDEPENWRLMVSLAQFYEVASRLDESYVEVAQGYGDDAAERAPVILGVFDGE